MTNTYAEGMRQSMENATEVMKQMTADTTAAITQHPTYIVHIRKIGPKGGKGERLRYTHPDEPPAAGSLLVFQGDTYRVLDVYEEGEG